LQLIGKKKKKTLVLTLGRSGTYTVNLPEKGGKKKKKKNPGINPGQLVGKGRGKKKKKKTLVLTLGRSPNLNFRT
jgi:hypothetical protein